MKGLLIKDLMLLKNNAQFFAILGIISLMFLIMYSNVTFVVSYITIMFSMFSISSISYDRDDNGMSFLFTLPVNRRDYVNSKYVFALIIILGSVTVSSFLTFAAGMVRRLEFIPEDGLMGAGSAVLCAGVMSALMIPLSLKFEAEKSRIVMPAVIGTAFVIAFCITKVIKFLGIEGDIIVLVKRIENANVWIVLGAILGITAILFFISYLFSFKIMEKKEF